MYKAFDSNKLTKQFKAKTNQQRQLVDEALFILGSLGIPIKDIPSRRLERMAMVFLATAQIFQLSQWKFIKDLDSGVSMKTRDIIKFINQHFNEEISSGSYDDIRRKDLKYLVLANIIARTNPTAARNDSTRGYAINPIFTPILKQVGSSEWEKKVKIFLKDKITIQKLLLAERAIEKIPIKLPTGEKLKFSLGEHNILQKKIVEEFLPRFGYGAEVLYVGDTADKFLFLNEKRLKELNFFELSHGELPDIVAYSKEKNWLYLIEAVHSSGPMSDTRLIELKKLTKECKADIVYVTAFLDKKTFKVFVKDIAWETEVWIADMPDHLIHFNGDKFLGPHKNP